MRYLSFFIIALLIQSCNNNEGPKALAENKELVVLDKLFKEKFASETNLNFTNTVRETKKENYYSYEFFYNGGGVAVGDLNNDGLADIYFSGNSADDKLYLNKGNLSFDDISITSGINEYKGWSTGVTMVDINADGWLDIYVCRSGPSQDVEQRTNRLFINNHDGTFTEDAAKFGLQSTDYSVQSAFFDYDLDGDLDMYLLNHPREKRPRDLSLKQHVIDVKAGKSVTDAFFENVEGNYEVRTKEANLYSYGYRHGIAVGDVNKDGFPDLFIASDFDDPDVFQINQGNKTFKNDIDGAFRHLSFNSMGAELIDINNDSQLDLYAVDMAPSDHFRSKAYMVSMNVKRFRNLVNSGLHHQYMFNMFQLNNGNGKFSEIGQYSGTAKTDWSWSPLFFDMDHDGYKDLFITNGIKENYLYRDIKKEAIDKYGAGTKLSLQQHLDIVPTDISENVIFRNKEGIKFENKSGQWAEPSLYNSNGIATADFDNDGDMDFVINNMDSSSVLYESLMANSGAGNSIKVILKGIAPNTNAFGAKIEFVTEKGTQWHELYTTRGYLSCVDSPVIFGMSNEESADINVIWPDGTKSSLIDVKANNFYTISYGENKSTKITSFTKISKMLAMVEDNGLDFTHKEDPFDDYKEQILLPHSQSNVGPSIIKGDVNGDGLEDVFIGGAARQAPKLFLQNADGKFTVKDGGWDNHFNAEDTGAVFIDIDNDNDLDLYVVSGGAHFKVGHKFLRDRIYVNDGQANFKYNNKLLPNELVSGKAVVAADIDSDGDTDLFIGGRILPFGYPQPTKSYFLINEGGKFTSRELDVNQMVSSALFSDYDNDGDKDLITVGEWSNILVFNNENGNFSKAELPSLAETTGIWFGLQENDIDNDGDMDYFVGNIGLNAKFKADKSHQFHIFGNDFDDNGTYDIVLSSDYHGKLVPSRGRECSSQQMPFITEKFEDYKSFASASLEDVYGEKLSDALHYQANMLYSVFLQNNGNGDFTIKKLPWQAQLSPLTDFEFVDINNDGKDEIISVGNLYNVEVETQRYDASIGAVFNYTDGEFVDIHSKDTGFFTTGDAREIISVNSNGKKILIVTNNNGPLDIFEILKKKKPGLNNL